MNNGFLKRKIVKGLAQCHVGEFYPKVYTNEDFFNGFNKELKEQIYQHLIDVETTTNRGEAFLKDIMENKSFILLTLWRNDLSLTEKCTQEATETTEARNTLIATRCFSFDIDEEIKQHLNIKDDALWLSKLVIKKNMRGLGVGRALIQRSNKILLSLPEINYLCGDTVYFGAIKLYMNLGVTVYPKDIDALYGYCSKEQNRKYFDELVSNPVFKEFKSRPLIRYWYDKLKTN